MGEDVRPSTPPGRAEPVEPGERHPDVHVVRSLVRCPFCHDEVRTDDATAWVACGGCLARHHASCWREASRCGTCGGTKPLALARPASRAALLAVVGLVAISLIVVALSALVYVTAERHPPPPSLHAVRAVVPVIRKAFPGETAPVTALRDAADAGDATAMFDVARALASGLGVGIDRRLAAEWYRRAGASGHAEASLTYADLLERGAPNAGIQRDPEEARLWTRRAAEQGSGEAAYRCARAGDDAEWVTWAGRAAALGHVPAMNALASRLMQPSASAEELAQVEDLLRRAEGAAVPIVMKRLADALWEGDHERALGWYRRAAERGDPDALALYPRALGELGRLEEADRWYQRAVGAGVPIRLQELGLLRARLVARPLLVDEPVVSVLPFSDPHLFRVELEAGVTYSLAVMTDMADARFQPELVVRDADSRVIDAPYGLLGGGELARPLRGRTEFTPRVSGRFYLQVHGQWGEDRRYTIAVRRVAPPPPPVSGGR